MERRMNRNRLTIGTYILQEYARSERHIKDLADCGIDFVTSMANDRKALDLFEKYGVGAIVNGVVPGWWGGDGSNAGKLETSNPPEKYAEAAARFIDHPAIWGIDIGDEPSALDFPYYGKVFRQVSELFPMQFPYLNLYPNYASVATNSGAQTVNQLGTATYKEHIAEYVKHVPSDYICYDFYVYSTKVCKQFSNYEAVSDACLRSGRSMWIVLQVNSLYPEKWISLRQLRYQANLALCYGAEVITWACYTAGWWKNQVLDERGEKTEQYEKLRRVNRELRTLGEEYMRFRRVGTVLVGFSGREELDELPGYVSPEAFSCGYFKNVQAGGNPIAVGEMVSRTDPGERALMICAAGDPQDKAPECVEITFESLNRNVQAFGGCGKLPLIKSADGTYSVTAETGSGVLITSR